LAQVSAENQNQENDNTEKIILDVYSRNDVNYALAWNGSLFGANILHGIILYLSKQSQLAHHHVMSHTEGVSQKIQYPL
jgi:hypothetical protein